MPPSKNSIAIGAARTSRPTCCRSRRRRAPPRRRRSCDIVIAYETVAREAAAEGRPFAHHVAHLAVHGFLHLLGYDHDSDAEADAMERLEARILARLDVPDPHIT